MNAIVQHDMLQLMRPPGDAALEECLIETIEDIGWIKPKHRQIVAAVLSGKFKRTEVAEAFRVSPITVTNIMKRPEVRKVVGRAFEEGDEDLNVLTVRSNDVLRKALDTETTPMKEALQAVAIIQRYNKRSQKEAGTAEDVVRDLLSGLQVNTQVNVTVGSE